MTDGATTAAGRTIAPVPEDRRAEVVARVEPWLLEETGLLEEPREVGAPHAGPLPGSLVGTYPQVWHPLADADLLGAWDGDALVSHVASRRVSLRRPDAAGGPFDAVLVGSVATDPAHRGQGLASALMAAVEEHARAAGADALLLWSDLADFYGRLGYTPAGEQLELAVRRRPGAPTTGVRPLGLHDVPAMLALHAAQPWGVQRDLGEIALLLSARNMLVVGMERGDRLVAYACYGKGVDFVGWWHELVGDDLALAHLLPAALELCALDETTVLAPTWRSRLTGLLGDAVATTTRTPVALRKALTPAGDGPLWLDGLDSI